MGLHARRDTTRVQGLAEVEIVENSGKYKTYFMQGQLRALEEIAGTTLASLGYTVASPASDIGPPAMRRQIWRLTDRIRFAINLVTAKARSPDPFPRRLMASRFRRALRQFTSEPF